jgi:hypothetical protein
VIVRCCCAVRTIAFSTLIWRRAASEAELWSALAVVEL